MWYKMWFVILNCLGMVHECDRQMDGQTEVALAITWSNDLH